MSPVDFWRLSPGEVWWIIEAHKPRDEHGRVPLTRDPEGRAHLRKILDEAKARENGASSR